MKRRDEVLVGIVATVAVALAAVGSLFLARGGLLPGYPVHLVLNWGAGLKQGQPVLLSGVNIGYVGDVGFRDDGNLVVTLRIRKTEQVPKGTTARVVPNGFFGDMMIAMTPDRPNPGNVFAAGDTIPAGPPAMNINDVLVRVDSIGNDLQSLTKTLRKEFVDEGGIRSIRRTVNNADALITTLAGIAQAQSAELTRTQQSLRRIANAVDSAQVDSTVRALGAAATNASQLATELRETNKRLGTVLGKLEGTDGSAGLLMNDPGLYRDVRGLLQRMDSLTADFMKNPKKYVSLSIF